LNIEAILRELVAPVRISWRRLRVLCLSNHPAASRVSTARQVRVLQRLQNMAHKARYAVAWLLGIPLPILVIVYLVSRC
jgi:hypothetical protein